MYEEGLIYFLNIAPNYQTGNEASLQECLKAGFVPVDKDNNILMSVPQTILDAYCYLYNTNIRFFYNNYNEVTSKSRGELWVDQVIHYFTTYGYEALGIKANVWVPSDELKPPEDYPNKFRVIQLLSSYECKVRFTSFLKESLTSIKDEQERYFLENLFKECYYFGDVDDIKSKEVKMIYCKIRGIVPNNPEDFLRFLVYLCTNKVTLIKDKKTIEIIKSCSFNSITKTYFELYSDYTKLAEIFFRYKPIFLAFKKHEGCAPIINKIRRLADTYHKPQSQVGVKNYSQCTKLEKADIRKKASNRELVKLINYYLNRSNNLYNIRNGKIWIDEEKTTEGIYPAFDLILLLQELKNRLQDVYKDKLFLLPKDLMYAIPTTEKQMMGPIPWGSFVKIPQNQVSIGISWENQEDTRVDLDLHARNSHQHIGWNWQYYSYEHDIVYTGDMTDAEHGASEAIGFFNYNKEESYVFSINKYSGPKNIKFNFFINEATKEKNPFKKSKQLITPITMSIESDMQLGFFRNGCFVFCGGSLSEGRIPRENRENYFNAFANKYDNTLALNESFIQDVLGGKVIYEIPEEEYIDLRPEALSKNTLLDLIDGKI